MNGNLQKLIDSNNEVSKLGRAHQYQLEHPLRAKHSANIVGGADNGIDQFAIIRKYHLKGFEYGNWVSNNDRYDHLIAANRSLKHLAQIIGSDNIGVNGNVGIAFGGRGLGGHTAAHYEPHMNMINLTKPSGAGCLAHEYGHALDFNFGSFIDQNKTYAALSGGWSTAQTLEENVGGQLRAMTNQLIDAVIRTDSHQKLRKKAGEYWLRRTEIFARFFEQYVCYKMRKISTDLYLTHTWNAYTQQIGVREAYLTEDELKGMLPLADKLVAELGKFLNGKGKLVTTPYPTTKRLKKAIKKATVKKDEKPALKPKEEIKKAAKPKTSLQRRNERIRQREESAEADHKLEKQTFKDSLKKNPEWIKAFAGKVGLSAKVIESMYAISAKDELRPVMNGIYCDAEGYIIATDAHILVAIKCKMPKSYIGKIFTPSGKVAVGKYPNWRNVMPTNYTRTGSFKDITGIVPRTIEGKYSYRQKQFEQIKVVDFNHTLLSYENLTKIKKVFVTLKETPDVLQLSVKDADAKVKKNKAYNAERNLSVYPETIGEVLSICPVQFISKSIKAIMMPMMQND